MLLRTIFFSLLVASAAGAAEPARTPSANWVVDFADSQCVASRNYGTAEDPLLLVLKAPPLGDVMQLAVVKRAIRTEAMQAPASVYFDGGGTLNTTVLMYTPEGFKDRVYVLNLRSSDFAKTRQARQIAIRSEGLHEAFALSLMDGVLKVLDDCVRDLRRVWNVAEPGSGGSPKISTGAKADLASFVGNDDYPIAASRRNQSGRVRFVLLVTEDGRVADCTVIETSGVAALDSQSCSVLKRRARFEPARGTDGKAVKDAVISSIQWKFRR